MNLSERDESDLVSLASSLGSHESDGRARRLMETNADAAEFYRQIRSIRDALEVQSDVGRPLLPDQETDALTAVILKRSKRRRSLRGRLLGRPWRWASVAAAVVIIAAGWTLYVRHDRSLVASATYVPVGAHLTIRGTDKRFDVPIKAGELVDGAERYTVLSLRNGSRMAMRPQTKLAILKNGQDIDLQTGCMFIQAAAATHVQAGIAALSLDEPNAKAIIELSPAGGKCLVQSGHVKLVLGERVAVLAAGQMGVWDLPSGELHILPLDNRATDWVREAFRAAAKDT
jgi:hypothetical protein